MTFNIKIVVRNYKILASTFNYDGSFFYKEGDYSESCKSFIRQKINSTKRYK